MRTFSATAGLYVGLTVCEGRYAPPRPAGWWPLGPCRWPRPARTRSSPGASARLTARQATHRIAGGSRRPCGPPALLQRLANADNRIQPRRQSGQRLFVNQFIALAQNVLPARCAPGSRTCSRGRAACPRADFTRERSGLLEVHVLPTQSDRRPADHRPHRIQINRGRTNGQLDVGHLTCCVRWPEPRQSPRPDRDSSSNCRR